MSLSRFEQALLTSGKRDGAPEDRRRAARVALMSVAGASAAAATLGAASTASGAAGAAASGTSAATAGVAGTAAASAAITASNVGLVKLVLLVVLSIGTVAGAVGIATQVNPSRALAPAPSVGHDAVARKPRPAASASASPGASATGVTPAEPDALSTFSVDQLPNAPHVSPRPTPPNVPPDRSTEEDPLATEARILEAARVCVARGDRACARARLEEHASRFRQPSLADEASLLSIDLALANGDRASARRLARSLLARSPTGSWSSRVKTLAEEPANADDAP